MALIDSFPGVSGATDFAELRKLLASLITRNADGSARPGVLLGKIVPLVTGRADLKVDVATFPFITVRNLGVMFGLNDGTVAVALGALPSANSRIDTLWVKQNIAASPTSDASDLPVFGWLTGTASATPQTPSLALLPPGAFPVANVQMAFNTTATNDGAKVSITQIAPYTALLDASVPFRSESDLLAWAAEDSARAINTQTNLTYLRRAGAWKGGNVTLTLDGTYDKNVSPNHAVAVCDDGRMSLEGIIRNAVTFNASANTRYVLGSVPAAYAPSRTLRFPSMSFSGNAPSISVVEITATGEIAFWASVGVSNAPAGGWNINLAGMNWKVQ